METRHIIEPMERADDMITILEAWDDFCEEKTEYFRNLKK